MKKSCDSIDEFINSCKEIIAGIGELEGFELTESMYAIEADQKELNNLLALIRETTFFPLVYKELEPLLVGCVKDIKQEIQNVVEILRSDELLIYEFLGNDELLSPLARFMASLRSMLSYNIYFNPILWPYNGNHKGNSNHKRLIANLLRSGFSLVDIKDCFSLKDFMTAGFSRDGLVDLGFHELEYGCLKNYPNFLSYGECHDEKYRAQKTLAMEITKIRFNLENGLAYDARSFKIFLLSSGDEEAIQALRFVQSRYRVEVLYYLEAYGLINNPKMTGCLELLQDIGYTVADVVRAGFDQVAATKLGFDPCSYLATYELIFPLNEKTPGKRIGIVSRLSQSWDKEKLLRLLRQVGCDKAEINAASPTPFSLKAAGYTMLDLLRCGYGADDLLAAGFARISVESYVLAIKASGQQTNLEFLRNNKYKINELKDAIAGFDKSRKKSIMQDFIVSLECLKGFTVLCKQRSYLEAIGITDNELERLVLKTSDSADGHPVRWGARIKSLLGKKKRVDQINIVTFLKSLCALDKAYTWLETVDALSFAGCTIEEFYAAGCNASDIKPHFELSAFIKSSYTLGQLLAAGFPLGDVIRCFRAHLATLEDLNRKNHEAVLLASVKNAYISDHRSGFFGRRNLITSTLDKLLDDALLQAGNGRGGATMRAVEKSLGSVSWPPL